MIRQARCCCGQAVIEVKGEPRLNALCHCDDCKRRTGSAFGISVYFMDNQVLGKSGDTRTYLLNTDLQQVRHFCAHCGTTLFWKTDTLPGMTGIAGGCFEMGQLGAPAYTVSNENKCNWLELPANLKTRISGDDLS